MGRHAAYGRALSPREQEALGWLCRGLARDDVARRMGVTPETVKAHARSVYRKLGVADRFAAAALALAREEA